MSTYSDVNKNCYDYPELKNVNDYECDEVCSCRFNSARSTRDKMDYDVYVLGKSIKLQPLKVEKYIQK